MLPYTCGHPGTSQHSNAPRTAVYHRHISLASALSGPRTVSKPRWLATGKHAAPAQRHLQSNVHLLESRLQVHIGPARPSAFTNQDLEQRHRYITPTSIANAGDASACPLTALPLHSNPGASSFLVIPVLVVLLLPLVQDGVPLQLPLRVFHSPLSLRDYAHPICYYAVRQAVKTAACRHGCGGRGERGRGMHRDAENAGRRERGTR